MNHTEALKAAAAPHLGLIDMYEAEQVVRAYLTARAQFTSNCGHNCDCKETPAKKLLADFGENA